MNIGRMLGNRIYVSLGYNLNVIKFFGFSSFLYNCYYSFVNEVVFLR